MVAIEPETVDAWERRIVREFAQCPALRLTAVQAARLWGLEVSLAESVLDMLVRRQMLFQMTNGMFVRRGACPRCE